MHLRVPTWDIPVVLGWVMGLRWGSAAVLVEKDVAERSGPFGCRGKERGDAMAAGGRSGSSQIT